MSDVSLVTGGAGFLGSHLAERLLERGHRVVVLDDLSGGYWRNIPEGCDFVQASITDAERVGEVFQRYRVDYVFHLAAYAAEGLSHFVRRYNYENNLLGSVSLINAAVRAQVKCFVYMSSAAVYGDLDGNDAPPDPTDPYGIAKLAVEQDLRAANKLFGMPYVVFRPHNVYGPRQNLSDPFRNVIGIFFKQILRGEPCTVFGDGTQTRNFSFVDDVVLPIARCVEIPETHGRVFDIGSDTPTTLNNLADRMQKILDRDVGVRYLPRRQEAATVSPNHAEARRVFGLSDGVDLEEGLGRTAEWAKGIQLAPPRNSLRPEITRELPPSWRDQLGPDID